MLYLAEIFLSKMCTERSYNGMEANIMVRGNTVNDWVGILKLFIVLFMMIPCCTENVCSCAKQQFIMIVLANIGSSPRNVFVSSTWAAVMVSSNSALSSTLQHNFILLSVT